ncbi:hypothetical protein DM01DRAFT_1382553 [Hesseltinella vesiculosa]|uniref:Uncharacterized protein n=1 Tax=Hesseltinella vesiculosa TaxID=101127 RepID=A0A1X2GKP9_9FUNG|nr:hypothetical protein DM01DRAFT_1382553 [Hesseltinella vesiculosa]
MATLELKRPKAKQNDHDETPVEQDSQAQAQQPSPNHPLEQLMLEPVTYDEDILASPSEKLLLSADLIHSLESAKYICLIALDTSLRQILRGRNRAERRHSDSSLRTLSPHSLLGSIDEHSRNFLPASATTRLRRRDSSPALATINHVQDILAYSTWPVHDTNDYDLACALAELLEHLYRILDSSTTADGEEAPAQPPNFAIDIYDQLQQSMSLLHGQAGQMATTAVDSQKKIWVEALQLMAAVSCFLEQPPATPTVDTYPPAYGDVTMDQGTVGPSENKKKPLGHDDHMLPSYCQEDERKENDLDHLVSSIDRLSDVMPRFNNQRADLSDRQARLLAAATMGKTIERLSRGRLEDQRASIPDVLDKQNLLSDLVAQLHRSSARSLDNQRFILAVKNNPSTLHLDVATKERLLDNQERPPEQQMIDEMVSLSDLLTKSMDRPRFNSQRFQLTPVKEKEVFLNHVLHKIDRMQSRRMQNQDAEWRSKEKNDNDELTRMFDHIIRFRSQLDNQRASFNKAN